MVSNVKYIKINIFNSKNNVLPSLPTSIQSVQEPLDSVKYKSSKGQDMLLYNDFNIKLVIMCCRSNLEVLCQAEILYINGTFEYCAKHFLQLKGFKDNLTSTIIYWCLVYKK